ncbi:MAG: hypothetical protein QNJ97_13815 [Myxococcota bacterium]|nr:hypothetical protein [Myxococcota bacterium]
MNKLPFEPAAAGLVQVRIQPCVAGGAGAVAQGSPDDQLGSDRNGHKEKDYHEQRPQNRTSAQAQGTPQHDTTDTEGGRFARGVATGVDIGIAQQAHRGQQHHQDTEAGQTESRNHN